MIPLKRSQRAVQVRMIQVMKKKHQKKEVNRYFGSDGSFVTKSITVLTNNTAHTGGLSFTQRKKILKEVLALKICGSCISELFVYLMC